MVPRNINSHYSKLVCVVLVRVVVNAFFRMGGVGVTHADVRFFCTYIVQHFV